MIDLFEADVETAEDVAYPEPLVVPPDTAVGANLTNLVVSGVDERFEAPRVRPVRGPVQFSWDFHSKSLMRPLVVELRPKRIEAFLLGPEVGRGRSRRLGLEGPVHTFVAAVLLGFSGFNELGGDAELDPPGTELGEPSEGHGSEGNAVVGADPFREAVGSENPLEHTHCGIEGGSQEPLALEEEAAVAVLDGEGVAVGAIGGLEVALEVSSPDPVGLCEPGQRPTRVRRSTASPGRRNEPVALQDIMGRALGWERPGGMLTSEVGEELLGPPGGVTLPGLEKSLDDVGRRQLARCLWPTRSLGQARRAVLEVTADPFVARLAADPVASA